MSRFGVGIIVSMPLLLELRLGAVRVAVLSVLGQLTTAWGAMGVAVVLTASLTRLPVERVGSLTALLSLPTALVLSLVCLQVSGGNAAVRRWGVLALAAAALLTGGAGLLSRSMGVELMGLLSSTLTLALLGGVGALVSRSACAGKRRRGEERRTEAGLVLAGCDPLCAPEVLAAPFSPGPSSARLVANACGAGASCRAAEPPAPVPSRLLGVACTPDNDMHAWHSRAYGTSCAGRCLASVHAQRTGHPALPARDPRSCRPVP
jgi:L-lactate permease